MALIGLHTCTAELCSPWNMVRKKIVKKIRIVCGIHSTRCILHIDETAVTSNKIALLCTAAAADRREAQSLIVLSLSRCVVHRLCACKPLRSSLLRLFHLSFPPLQLAAAPMRRIVQRPSSIAWCDAFCEWLIASQSQKPCCGCCYSRCWCFFVLCDEGWRRGFGAKSLVKYTAIGRRVIDASPASRMHRSVREREKYV